jgi:hypothetical protein
MVNIDEIFIPSQSTGMNIPDLYFKLKLNQVWIN